MPAIELSDRLDNRDGTEKRYSFIQESLNEVSLGKLLWCDFFVPFYVGLHAFVYNTALSTFSTRIKRVALFTPVPSAQEWVWCNDFVKAVRFEPKTRLENNLNTEMQMASFIRGALGPPPNYKLIKVCPSIKYWFWLFSFCRLSCALDILWFML